MLDPKTALDTYRSLSQAKTHQIARFVSEREGFDLSRNEAEHLDDMMGIMVDQMDAMEDLWDDIIEIVHQYPIDIYTNQLLKSTQAVDFGGYISVNSVIDPILLQRTTSSRRSQLYEGQTGTAQ